MKTNNLIWLMQQARENGRKEGIKFTVRNYSSVILLCLKDKFDFTPEQLQQAAVYINDTFDSVCEGYLSLDDIDETLKEENDITITFNSKEIGVLMNNTEEFQKQYLDSLVQNKDIPGAKMVLNSVYGVPDPNKLSALMKHFY